MGSMRGWMLAMLMFAGMSAVAQSPEIWNQVNPQIDLPQLPSVTPSDTQLKAIAALLRRVDKKDIWECEGNDRDEMIKGLTFQAIPLAPEHKVLLAQAGEGCARGGQGSNGAMWLIRFKGGVPILMASPQRGFNGWLYAIQASASHGYRDIVLGWHMGADEAVLNYFRFDGKSYVAIGSATNTEGKIVPGVQ
ncbi:hypothetical protein P8935_19035 [Telmatobacter sp. DSM 110680]|uniref:Uncharacterized protein n=1 Tax=Telmatobacter sp. DSM 110680 TaxID=3036704 RepID=A0AAU7DF95_9BACT